MPPRIDAPGSQQNNLCPNVGGEAWPNRAFDPHLRLPRPPCSTSDACAATILRACEACSTYACESV